MGVTAEIAEKTSNLAGFFDRQRSAFQKQPPDYSTRLDALRRLDRALVQRQEEIKLAISDDFGGRAPEETATLELFPVVNEIRHAVRNLRRWMESRHAAVPWQFWPAQARVVYQPLGVAGILSAWNYPLFLSLAPVVGAIAAGNHVMLKPSELAPCTAELMRCIIADLYPPEYITVIAGDAEVAADFSRLPFGHLLYTGSERVGRLVMKAASENLTPVTLELGGKSPALIHPEYPLRKAAERILAGKLYNAGQTCVAPDYVLVPASSKSDFIAFAQDIIRAMYPRLVDNPGYTRIINTRHYVRLRNLVDEAQRQGADVIEIDSAGEDCNNANRVFPPTLLWNIGADMAIMQEEIFGPVLPIIPYNTLDEALEYVNTRPHPLAFYYFDHNGKRIDEVLQRTMAGGVTVNDCIFHVGQPNLPFGGVGASGMGHYHGFDGFETFSKKKGVFLQSRWTPLSLLRPPYTEATRKMMKFLIG